MKLFLSLALLLVSTKQANAQCSFTFCGGAENIEDPSFLVSAEFALSCEDLPDTASTPGITEEDCAQIQNAEYVCCPSQTKQACFNCGDTAAAFNEAKELVGGGGATCGDFNNQVLRMIPPMLCDETRGETGVNLASYCECAGTVAPDTCKVCGNGQTVNTTAIVDEAITCAAGIEYAKHVTNQTYCNMEIATADNKKKCCMDAAAGKSGGIDLSISSLIAALIAGLAFAI